jgi:hypothetical protein
MLPSRLRNLTKLPTPFGGWNLLSDGARRSVTGDEERRAQIEAHFAEARRLAEQARVELRSDIADLNDLLALLPPNDPDVPRYRAARESKALELATIDMCLKPIDSVAAGRPIEQSAREWTEAMYASTLVQRSWREYEALAAMRAPGAGRVELAAESIRTRRARQRLELRTRRDEIRQNSIAHQTQGPPSRPIAIPKLGAHAARGLLEAIEQSMRGLDQYSRGLASLREQVIAASNQSTVDEWVSQRDPHVLPPRVRTRICRALIARGDARATVVGRIHCVRRSALDEHMRGASVAAIAAPLSSEAQSVADMIRRKFAELEAAQ